MQQDTMMLQVESELRNMSSSPWEEETGELKGRKHNMQSRTVCTAKLHIFDDVRQTNFLTHQYIYSLTSGQKHKFVIKKHIAKALNC